MLGKLNVRHSTLAARGVSLIELVVFIVIVSVGIAGILGVMNLTNKSSADPLIHKQALAIAEAYLEEALSMPFTYCDPDDTAAAGALSTADCTTPEVIGAEGGETRGGSPPFDNVNDYSALPTGSPSTADTPGTPITKLNAYQVSVAVTQEALSTVPVAASLRVTVTVTGPAATTVRLDGYRTRYAPNALP